MAETKRDKLRQRSSATPSNITNLMQRMAAGINTAPETLPVVVAPDKSILVGEHFIIRETGLEIIGQIDRSLWIEFMRWLRGLDSTVQWVCGDAVVYADEQREQWIAENEITEYDLETKYKELLETTGYSYSSLTKFATYARRFLPFRRRKGLSYSHHVEVATLTDEQQDMLFDQAEAENWSRDRLRLMVQKLNALPEATSGDTTAIVPAITDSPAPIDEDEMIPRPAPVLNDLEKEALTFFIKAIRKNQVETIPRDKLVFIRKALESAERLLDYRARQHE